MVNLFLIAAAGLSLVLVTIGSILTLLLGKRKVLPQPPGLLFHSISQNPALTLSQFSTKKFESLLDMFYKKEINIVPVKNAPNLHDTSACTLTFDDGLECIYTHALPILQKFGFKATVFCVAGFIGKKASWDVYKGNSHMTESQIRKLAELGHEIGSHTLTHSNLPYLNDQDLSEELKNSKKILEDITGKPVTSLSFPHGSWNRRVWDMALESGYTAGTVYRGHSNLPKDLLPVYGVYRFDNPIDVYNKLFSRGNSISLTLGRIIPHFAKGTPIWKFRNSYSLIR